MLYKAKMELPVNIPPPWTKISPFNILVIPVAWLTVRAHTLSSPHLTEIH